MIEWLFYSSYLFGAVSTLLGMYSYTDNSGAVGVTMSWLAAIVWPVVAVLLVLCEVNTELKRIGAWINEHDL